MLGLGPLPVHNGDGATVVPISILSSAELLRSFEIPSGVLPEGISKIRGSLGNGLRILHVARPHLCGTGVDPVKAELGRSDMGSVGTSRRLVLIRDSVSLFTVATRRLNQVCGVIGGKNRGNDVRDLILPAGESPPRWIDHKS